MVQLIMDSWVMAQHSCKVANIPLGALIPPVVSLWSSLLQR